MQNNRKCTTTHSCSGPFCGVSKCSKAVLESEVGDVDHAKPFLKSSLMRSRNSSRVTERSCTCRAAWTLWHLGTFEPSRLTVRPALLSERSDVVLDDGTFRRGSAPRSPQSTPLPAYCRSQTPETSVQVADCVSAVPPVQPSSRGPQWRREQEQRSCRVLLVSNCS